MRILLTNDDGPTAPGLCALAAALGALGEVTVVCPADEQSGVSHGITFRSDVRVRTAVMANGAPACTVSGTPADCVKLAMLEVFEQPPDLIVSGVNPGTNAGVAAFYSGTIAAALEGMIQGVPSIAFSMKRANIGREDDVAALCVRVTEMLLALPVETPWVFNVNVPEVNGSAPPIRLTRQSGSYARGAFSGRIGPDGADYRLDWTMNSPVPEDDSDVAALERGEVSVTPLCRNLTDADLLKRLRGVLTDVHAAP